MTTAILCAVLAVLSVWEYPSRQGRHETLRADFIAATQQSDVKKMVAAARAGARLLPDDPTWHYNLACALSYLPKRNHKEAFAELEKAIDLGIRDPKMIASDKDLKRLAYDRRLEELVAYAELMSTRPMMLGPNAHVTATGVVGSPVAFGEQNLVWDLNRGIFEVDLRLADFDPHGNAGDLYMNRDGGHSVLDLKAFPDVTEVRLDRDGHARGMDLDMPNMHFPYPVFGNASRAFVDARLWRSIPRMLMTRDAWRMKSMAVLYLSNQLWVFPAHHDCPPAGKFGDVFASISPYFLVTEGSSFTDKPYLAALLEASRSLRDEVKVEAVKGGLLAPTLMTLLRKSLANVSNETDYLSVKAHPTAFAAGRVDTARLKAAASSLAKEAIPPLAPLVIGMAAATNAPTLPETTYLTPYSSAFVLRSADTNRSFLVQAVDPAKVLAAKREAQRKTQRKAKRSRKGKVPDEPPAEESPLPPPLEFAFVLLRDGDGAATLTRKAPDVATVDIVRTRMTGTNRVDLAVFAKTAASGWGAPSYVSFAVMDPDAPYCDPVLLPAAPKSAPKPAPAPAK